MKRNKIPEDIGEHFKYEDGKLFKLINDAYHPTGNVNGQGYIITTFRKIRYRAHRIIWFLVKGEQPPENLDHINNDKTDNRIENLRVATTAQNAHNERTPINNTSGVKGILWDKQTSKWRGQVKANGKKHCAGRHTDIKDAENAVRELREKLHGEYANHG